MAYPCWLVEFHTSKQTSAPNVLFHFCRYHAHQLDDHTNMEYEFVVAKAQVYEESYFKDEEVIHVAHNCLL